jgi:hypothetical protein
VAQIIFRLSEDAQDNYEGMHGSFNRNADYSLSIAHKWLRRSRIRNVGIRSTSHLQNFSKLCPISPQKFDERARAVDARRVVEFGVRDRPAALVGLRRSSARAFMEMGR